MSSFFEDAASLDQVDWAVIEHWSWRNREDDPDRKRRKQAEFLIHQSFPWPWVEGIGVIDTEMAEQVGAILASAEHQPPILVQRNWYY
jgi:hypothetical protein